MPGKIYELAAISTINKPDIILITESWCNPQINDAALSVPGYRLESDLRNDRHDTGNGIGGGLIVYTKKGVKVELTSNHSDNNFNQFCEFKVLTKNDPINIVLIYRPPSSPVENLENMCKIMRKLDKNSVVIGDINLPDIDWKNEKSTSKGRRLLDTVLEEGLAQLIEFTTHTKGNILDLLITNCQEKVIAVQDVGRLGKSDHCMIEIKLNCQQPGQEQPVSRTDWRKADWEGLREEFRGINWWLRLENKNVEEAWQEFKQSVEKAVEIHVPKSTVRGEGKPRWLTREITKLLGQKKQAWRTLKLYRTQETVDRYHELEKTVKRKIQSAKRRMEKEIAECKDNNGRKFNRYIKSKTKCSSTIGPLRNAEGLLTSNESEMAECLNMFFASMFTAENLAEIPAVATETAAVLQNIPISRKKIIEKIKKLKADSAPGPDNVQARLLKELAEELSEPLRLIFTRSLAQGTVPTDWKLATVVPIFKKGPKGDPGNYRPVSLTSIPCKLLESIVKDELMSHLNSNSLIRSSQHGFMSNRSCTTNLIEFMEKVTTIVDEQKAADIFYLDFAKAFDTVPHKRLILKLKAKGVSGPILAWIEEWLSGRTQIVKIGNHKSSSCNVESGVPQGTVLGPPLFTVFIDDVDEEATLITLLLKFADDTKGVQEIAGPDDSIKLQTTLNNLCNWADRWGMRFNVKKCKIMHIGLHNPRYKYYMRGQQLGVVEEEKDIGVIIHNSLKPHKQCQKAATTATAVLRTIEKNFHYRDRNVFMKLYKQYVRPHLEFATPVWSPWASADIAALERVQEKATKMVTGLTAKTYVDRCRELGLDSLEKRRKNQDMVHTFKVLHETDPAGTGSIFERFADRGTACTRMTADPLNIRPKRARLEIRRNFFSLRVIDDWNKLKPETKSKKSIEAFKSDIQNQSTV